MKSIHKKIIRLQAAAMTKAVSRIEASHQDNSGSAEDRVEFRGYKKRNNDRFIRAKQIFGGYCDSVKAKLLRELFRTTEFDHYRNSVKKSGWTWALYLHGNTYSMKQIVFVFTALRDNGIAQTKTATHDTLHRIKTWDQVISDQEPRISNFATVPTIYKSIVDREAALKTLRVIREGRDILKAGTARFNTAGDLIASLDKGD